MATWTCKLREETLVRIKEYLSHEELPDRVTVEAPEDAAQDDVRTLAANALVAKVTAWGGNHEREIVQALTDRNSMECTLGGEKRVG